jgi:putative transposase
MNRLLPVSRRLRVVVPNIPLHITQRGVDRCLTFLTDEDFAFYRWALREAAIDASCAVHAYVLMTNHVHLLVSPAEPTGPMRMMISLGRRYVRYFNHRYRRTGTLWEGRYRSALVHSATYFFNCSRYIESNPVRSGMVARPGAYEWSSFRANALAADDPVVTPHAQYTALGEHRDECCSAYRALFVTALDPREVASIRAAPRSAPPLHASYYRQFVDGLRDGLAAGDSIASVQGVPRRTE